jgi:hypothetical protein
VKLAKIESQKEFGPGIEYVPEDFYDAAGAPVSAIRAELPKGYELVLLDVNGDGRFTPQGTYRRCLQFVADHGYMHRGQLADARRAAGLPRMWL